MCVVFDGAMHALGARCSGRAGAVGSQPVVRSGEARLGEHRRASGLRESTVLVVDSRPLHVCGVFTNERGAPVRDRQCAEVAYVLFLYYIVIKGTLCALLLLALMTM